jgi:hypothetical protein
LDEGETTHQKSCLKIKKKTYKIFIETQLQTLYHNYLNQETSNYKVLGFHIKIIIMERNKKKQLNK